MDQGQEWYAARAALEWQLEMGVDEAMLDTPQDRFAIEAALKAAHAARAAAPVTPPAQVVRAPEVDPVGAARRLASGASDLGALRAAMAGFDLCALKRGARTLVFADGVAGARVMLVGEPPVREEDMQGKPFVGRAGQLLDRMLAAVGLSRAESVYITNVLPWRPPQNRDPKPEEIAMLMPFLERHIALADPDLLVVMGNTSAQALLGKRGITRLRGTWTEAAGRPALPMLHPAYLLRTPHAKRAAWADWLSLKAKLKTLS